VPKIFTQIGSERAYGKFAWPGFGETCGAQWMIDRIEGNVQGTDTCSNQPTYED
jgi:GTP-dependent phosphoenolpyruvate carboxykinase